MRISDWSSDVCSSDLGSSPPCCEGADHASGRLMLKGRHAAIRPAAATRAAFDFTMLLLENAAMAQLCEILPHNPALSRRGGDPTFEAMRRPGIRSRNCLDLPHNAALSGKGGRTMRWCLVSALRRI